jgi:hypothetical protein
MLKKSLSLLSLSLILAGCFAPPETRDQKLFRIHHMCTQYGFMPGTDGFAQCMQKQDIQERLEREQSEQRSHEDYLANRQINAMQSMINNKK